jgi:RNA polymerase sigma-70 factor (ECF subfamily)
MRVEGGIDHPVPGGGEDSAATSPLALDGFWQNCLALRPKLASYLRAMLPDHHAVDDCLQETYLLMAERYREAGADDFSPLAFTCARNKARSWLAKQKVGRLEMIDPELMVKVAEAAAEAGAPSQEIHSVRIEALRDCLSRLKPEDREVMEARYGEDSNASLTTLATSSGRRMDALYKKLERLRSVLKQCVTAKLAARE